MCGAERDYHTTSLDNLCLVPVPPLTSPNILEKSLHFNHPQCSYMSQGRVTACCVKCIPTFIIQYMGVKNITNKSLQNVLMQNQAHNSHYHVKCIVFSYAMKFSLQKVELSEQLQECLLLKIRTLVLNGHESHGHQSHETKW